MYLNCHTYYSLRFGTFSEDELIVLAIENQVQTLALTDINNTSGCLSFIKKCQKQNIKPLVGVDFRNGNVQQYVMVAKNNQGFQEINAFLSYYLERKQKFPDIPSALKNVYVIYNFEKALMLDYDNFKPYEFIGVSVENIRKLKFSKLKTFTDKLCIQQQVTIRDKKDFNAHRLLRAIDNNIILSKLPKTEECLPTDKMLSVEDLEMAFEDFPFIIKNTQQILNSCTIDFKFDAESVSQNLKLYGNNEHEDYEALLKLCNDNLHKKYKVITPKIKKRLQTELDMIKSLRFVTFFLINHDIVNFARNKGYLHIGRGSGANSIVAYIIGITNVDPIELDLYFERFINPYRASPPDFDIDFSWKDRDEVTQYIFNRFANVALLATYSTFKYRAVIRELGKVFGLPKFEIDKLCINNYPIHQLDDIQKLVVRYSKLIHGFPNYVSVHSAGILILERPVHYYSATDIPPKGFKTVQFDMRIAEDVGIYKFDILGQRGLGKIKETLEIIQYNQPNADVKDIEEDIDAFKTDDKLNALLQKGKAIGAYYIESPAMRGLMKKMRTKNYIELVAASSIIRPGVSSSGMKNEYIKRHRYPEERQNALPALYKIMPETYGVMVYQEDVMKVASIYGGLDLTESDVIRRGMSGKYRSKAEFEAVERKFIANCRAKGYNDKEIFDVWAQMKSFAGYAFAKGHSASYAVESYQSLYLKHYFPLEFMVAVLNNGGGFYSREFYIHEARMQGGKIHAPCINKSDHPNCIYGNNIYLGFGNIKSLEIVNIQRILSQRQLYGKFLSLENFINRINISLEQLIILIRIGAFRFTGKSKSELLWTAHFKLQKHKSQPKTPQLFYEKTKSYTLPQLEYNKLEDAYDEMELLGFPLCSYFDLVDERICKHIKANQFESYIGKTVLMYGVLVNTRFHGSDKVKKMRFATFVDSNGDFFDTVHFSDVVDKYPITGRGVYACYGTVNDEFGHQTLTIIQSKKVAIKPDPRAS